MKLAVAVIAGGFIYVSSDAGATWTQRGISANWQSVASSLDGGKMVAVAYGGQVYISTDAGVTWVARETNRNWQCVTLSATGKITAGANSGQLFTSWPTTTTGTGGYLQGGQFSAIELQYIGNNRFVPVSHEGSILAF